MIDTEMADNAVEARISSAEPQMVEVRARGRLAPPIDEDDGSVEPRPTDV